jgi:hypothetical protein
VQSRMIFFLSGMNSSKEDYVLHMSNPQPRRPRLHPCHIGNHVVSTFLGQEDHSI